MRATETIGHQSHASEILGAADCHGVTLESTLFPDEPQLSCDEALLSLCSWDNLLASEYRMGIRANTVYDVLPEPPA